MANRRMFSLKIIDTDLFLDMSISARLLYYDLSMRADDDGFVASPKKIQRMVGASDDDLKILIAKQFIIPFDSGICVIKHWRVHNYIQKDRYNPTFYKLEMSMLQHNNGTYKLVDTQCIQDVSKEYPQVKLELDKSKDRLDNNISKDICSSSKLQSIINKWNSLGISQIKIIQGNRLKLLKSRMKEFGEKSILEAIDNVNKSSFLQGQNSKGWTITFDWFIKPNNFIKVLEENYSDKGGSDGYRQHNKKNEDAVQFDFSEYEG